MKTTDLLPSLPARSRVLFVRLRSLGDTVLSTPLYTALKAWRPDLQIAVLVEPPNDEVLRNNPDIDQLISLRESGTGRVVDLLARWEAIQGIRAAGFDCCVNLHGGSTSAWLTRLSGARHRVGARGFRNTFVYNHHIEVSSRNSSGVKKHTVEYQMDWLRYLGLPASEIPPLRVIPDPALKASVQSRLAGLGVDPDAAYCVIQPTSRFYTKEWTAEGFAEAADYVRVRHGLKTVLTGGLGEDQKLHQVAARCRLPVAIIQSLSVSELAWVICSAKLFIGNDSGPTHLAAALGVPLVVLFGSSDSQVWRPWKAGFQLVQNPFDCNPCAGYRCLTFSEPKCILSISASQVTTAVDAVLQAR